MRARTFGWIAAMSVGGCSLAGLDDYASGTGGTGGHATGGVGGDAGPDGAACTTCGGSCVDTQSDPQNCGACGVVCASGYGCGAGVCDNAVVDVAAGHNACAVLRSGEVWCWGRDSLGEVGIPSTKTDMTCAFNNTRCQSVPVKVAGISGAVEVLTGRAVTCARTAAGEVYCWGSNEVGLLGHDPATDSLCAKAADPNAGQMLPCSPAPRRVELPAGVVAAQLALGSLTACIVSTTKDVYCWGSNVAGEIKAPVGGTAWKPEKNANVNGDAEEVQINTRNESDATVCVRQSATGYVRCWGASHSGMLFPAASGGMCTTEPGCDPVARTVPMVFSSKTGALVADGIRLGSAVGCASAEGKLLCWGDNRYGQSGLGSGGPMAQFDPTPVPGLPPVKGFSVRLVSSVILDESGGVWSVGWADEGQLGDGSFGADLCPAANGQHCANAVKQVPGLTGITKVAAGNYTSAAIAKDGKLWMWGANYIAGLGHAPGAQGDTLCGGTGSNLCNPTPQLVSGLP